MKFGTEKMYVKGKLVCYDQCWLGGGASTNYQGRTVLHVVVFLSGIFICKFHTLIFQAKPN